MADNIEQNSVLKRERSLGFGGPEGIRTLDLSDANRTLSQLSYGPVYEVFGDVNCLPATELDYRKRGAITEPLLLPTELQAQIAMLVSQRGLS